MAVRNKKDVSAMAQIPTAASEIIADCFLLR